MIRLRALAPIAAVVMFGALWGCGEVRTLATDATTAVIDSDVVHDADQVAIDATLGNVLDAQINTACQDYCTTALASCTNKNQLFSDMGDCLTSCAGLPVGVSKDINVNSVHCRTYHATIAAENTMARTHCPHASISGDGVCGSLCEAYCSQMAANCATTSSGYVDQAACMAACEPMPVGNYNDTSGDSVQCRTYHAGTPAVSDAQLNCQYASITGGGQCVSD